MQQKRRKCHVHAIYPITYFSSAIIGHVDMDLSTEEIYELLCRKAEIYEYLPSGKIKNLDFSNYNKEEPKEKCPIENYRTEAKPVEILKPENVNIESLSEEVDDNLVNSDCIDEDIGTSAEPNIDNTKEKSVEVLPTDESPVKTHSVSSRNNNYKNDQSHYNNKKSKNKNKR